MILKKRHFLWLLIVIIAATLVVSGCSGGGNAKANERMIRKLVILSNPQGVSPKRYEAVALIVEQLKQLGLNVEQRAMPWEQSSDLVWYSRDEWDATIWTMVGRPERMDPDEFTYNLFHSTTAEKGYNFVGYINPEYDALAEAQRTEMDQDARQQLIFDSQEIIRNDSPYVFLVYPHTTYAYRNDVWNGVVDAKALGIKNFWTFVEAEPKGAEKDMILNSSRVVTAINPLYVSGAIDSWVTELIYDRLMRMDKDGLPKPWAAKEVKWIDDTTVEVVIRSGMKWHDGQPLTVEDVIFSFEAPTIGDAAPMYKPFVAKIESIEKKDDQTVIFHLTEPYAAFEAATLAKINLIPKHIWEPVINDLVDKPENAESYQEEVPVGSGPFKFAHWKQSEEIMLSADKDHFAAPKMTNWILRIVPNTESALGMLESGELNFLSAYDGDPELLAEKADNNENITMVASMGIDFTFLALNNRRAPFDDPAFRRAISYAIPRQTIVDNIYKGFATPADAVVTKAIEFWHNPNLDDGYDLERARQILKDAGYEWDKDGNLLYPEGKTETLTPFK